MKTRLTSHQESGEERHTAASKRDTARCTGATAMPDMRASSLVLMQLQQLADNSVRTTQPEACRAKLTGLGDDAMQRTKAEELFQDESGARPTAQSTEKPNNTGLPNRLKAGIESLSGMSMDHVKVHYNSDKPAQLNAHAYAEGSDIHIAPGQQEHLPHEAWHVVQQMQGRVRPTKQMKGMIAINDDPGLEREADLMGARALVSGSLPGQHDEAGSNDMARSCVPLVGTVQRLMSADAFMTSVTPASNEFEHIARRLEKYHELEEEDLDQRQVVLDNLSTKVYLWLQTNKVNQHRRSVYALLDDIQQEHLKVIQDVVTQRVTPKWLDEDPEPTDHAELWVALVKGNGSLRIIDQDWAAAWLQQGMAIVADFKVRMLANMARIMSKSRGLALVRSLMNHPLYVNIIPKTNAVNQIIEHLQGAHAVNSPGVAAPMATGLTKNEVSTAVGNSSHNLTRYGAIDNTHKSPEGHPLGQMSIVAMDPNMTDSSYEAFNGRGERIPSPVFVALAHELQHAEHNVKGHNTHAIKQLGEKNRLYPNLEELETIEQSPTGENAIREEHMIETRMGHTGAVQLRTSAQRPPAASSSAVVQAVRVYQHPTRPLGSGFSEDEMYKHFSTNAAALSLENNMGERGFRYVGDTATASKANTDFATKHIRINKNLTAEVAALSFVYELTNASQEGEFEDIKRLATSDTPSAARATQYAERILHAEARSVLARSQMALSMQKGELIKNEAYNKIASRQDLSETDKVEQVFAEMKANGKVHGGTKQAFDHYVEQFWEINKHTINGMD